MDVNILLGHPLRSAESNMGDILVKLRYRPAIFLLLAIIFSSSSFGQQPLAQKHVEADVKKVPPRQVEVRPVTTQDVEDQVAEALRVIGNNYGGTKSINYNYIVKSSIDSMLHSLDPHSNYFDAKENEQFRTDQSSRYYGIGATIGDLSDKNGNVIATYIKATFDGAPANRGGLRYGDKIVEVNGKSTLGKPFSEVRDQLRGEKGTTAKIVVERLATGKRETIDIIRDAVSQPSIGQHYMIRPGVGYLAMQGGFNQTTYAEFVTAMRDLRVKGMQQVVLDLRDNGGGLVREAYRIASSFLNKGQTIFTQVSRRDEQAVPADNIAPDRSPVIILVNRNSASASEILAGALQDHDRALIVGENTFGKGLVQNPFPLDYGSMLLLTIAKYQTPSGRLIQRDYSNGDLYDYYTEGGSFRDEKAQQGRPKGLESRTDTGRVVYSGGGLAPDVNIKPKTIPIARARGQQKLANPVFAFAMELVVGNVKGFETYKVDKPLTFDYDIKNIDFPMTPALFEAFKKFAADKYAVSPTQANAEKEFIQRVLRTELVTAAYGSQTSFQVTNGYDDQLNQAMDLFPQAKQLASESAKISTGRKVRTVN